MTIFSFWIYDRHCNCIYSREYTTTATSPSSASVPTPATQPTSPKKLATASSSTTAVDSNSTATLTSAPASTATLTNGANGMGTASSTQVHKLTPSDSMLNKGLINVNNNNNASKLLFGTIFSLRKISNSLSSTPNNNNNNNNNDGTSFEGTSLNKGNLLKSFQTLNYKCHFYETLTGLKLMLLTDPQCRDLQGELSQIYQVFYVNDVVRNQLMAVDFKDGEVISSEVFTRDVDSYWTSLPEFAS
ncbi:unnamed protein product [Ambrosiozyma monospora]|uniref:Unnamed protein product n=1 Tax=Ambrosiozyma monospora TaxID=43982 RepID=A0ACB5T5Z4_AMBMO|nr:unnamed protein product [Ambrosiozyma monospora]